MTTVQAMMLVDGALGGVLLVYDDVAWSIVTGVLQVAAWMLAFFGAVGAVAGGLGYVAGLALG